MNVPQHLRDVMLSSYNDRMKWAADNSIEGGEHIVPVPFRWGSLWLTVRWVLLDGRWECVGLHIELPGGNDSPGSQDKGPEKPRARRGAGARGLTA